MVRTGIWRYKFIAIILGAVLLFNIFTIPVSASPKLQTCGENLTWLDQTVGSFVIVYTSRNVNLAQEFISNFGEPLEMEFQNYSLLFGVQLETPITVRIYPTKNDYFCLNALAPLITDEDTHSHIGSREIALIGTAINRYPDLWYSKALNAMRHEFAALYSENITAGNAPPGLLKGIGGYFENPFETFEERFSAARGIQSPTRSLQHLLEEDVPASDSSILLQQTSFVAYLIDVYGWDRFINFLEVVGETGGYRQAFTAVYELNVQEVQIEWENYFPQYVESRWQANIVYAYDLGRYDILNAAGAYQDSLTGLKDAQPIVSLFGTAEENAKLEEQLRIANQGVAAGNLTLGARQAILAGDYSSCIEKAEEAISIYNQLEDTRRIHELEVYRDTALEILTLRNELEGLKGFDTPFDAQKASRILRIGQRLSELGDSEGVREVQVTMILLSTGQRHFVEWITIIGLLVCVYLIYRRLRDLLRKKPPEVNLL